ncbi:MAG: hypothetical protein A4E28_01276 [Methanocella sp. PtaU1.Bin125]|nr:MAG: hypothetical protein A4E28_01276 [Methanocella sp. PtaU1.Bin125]
MRIIGYSSLDKALLVSTWPLARGPVALDISGEVALVLGKRGCAGRWDGETHVPCGSDQAPVCDSCGAEAVDPCVMCRGVCRKLEKTCLQEHSVYLAAFAPGRIKVGVSRAFRLERRLAEQGADAGFEIARLPDGEAARQMEASLRALYPDRMAFEDKLATGTADGAIDTILKNYAVIRSLRFRHFSRELWMRPIVIKPGEGMAISGATVGIKGKALVIEKRGTLYALNLDSLAGYDCELKKGRASLQSSLLTY